MNSRNSEWNLKDDALAIAEAGVDAVRPENLIPNQVTLDGDMLRMPGIDLDLNGIKRVFVTAVGKAAPFMAESLMAILGGRVSGGIYLFLPGQDRKVGGLTALPASHPLPDEKSERAARAIMELAEGLGAGDLLILLLSGGGSAQICLPAPGITLAEKRHLTDRLMRAGADISELNTVRKHLSGIKGGRLAAAAHPAAVVSLIISDVIGNDLATIASGPTYGDASTFRDTRDILEKYALLADLPPGIRRYIDEGIAGAAPESLAPSDPVFRNVANRIIGDNRRALAAARRRAEELGYRTLIAASADRGEAREAARRYTALIAGCHPKHPLCLLAGGELTVTVRGRGRGGRNQEFVLAALPLMEEAGRGFQDWLVLSLGTDGIDGPTDAAGAWIGPEVLDRVRDMALDPFPYLDDNDAYHFFEKAGSLIRTGPTRTNVMDVRVFLLRP